MPSTSDKQHNFMEAVAHDKGFAKKAGVSQSVGKDFAKADDKAGITKNPPPRTAHMQERKDAGQSYRAVADEFGVSASTVHRNLKRGYSKEGPAK